MVPSARLEICFKAERRTIWIGGALAPPPFCVVKVDSTATYWPSAEKPTMMSSLSSATPRAGVVPRLARVLSPAADNRCHVTPVLSDARYVSFWPSGLHAYTQLP